MDIARRQLLAYPTAEFETAEAIDAAIDGNGFMITLSGGAQTHAKRLVLATGLKDHLPDVPGMREMWGVGVNQCPYCHGYEVADRRLAIFGTGDWAVHFAGFVRDWSDSVTLLTHSTEWLTADHRAALEAQGIGLDEAPVARLISSNGYGKERELGGVEFTDGRTVAYGALFIVPETSLVSSLAERLGCEIEQGQFGPRVKTDATKETTVPGVFAAGDATLPIANATLASADGVSAGAAAHRSLHR